MIYLHTESLKIKHTKGRPTKSEPAFFIHPTPTIKPKNQNPKKVAGCGLRFTTNKTYQYRYSSSSNNHLSNFSRLLGKASL